MAVTNVKSVKMCAFCKYWYDPTNSAISPKTPQIGMWEYDNTCRKKCLQKNLEMNASAFCSKYECKI